MRHVPQQTTRGECALPSLRTRLRKRHLCLAVAGLLVVGAVVDVRRDAVNQVGSRVYITAVRGYQVFVRPWMRGYVRCRYHPSCSEYSIEAVEKHGLCRGVGLTVSRICSCRTSIPLGTYDPVPASKPGYDVVDADNRKLD
jgi:uncharacterized protein